MEYKYIAATSAGGAVTGILTAETEERAERMLWDSGLTIIDLKKILKMPALHEAVPSLFGVKRQHVISYSRGLANLLEAGIPILRALTIQSQFGNGAFRAKQREVIDEVQKGARLSEACGKFPNIFPNFYVYLLRTGEEVGNLADVLKETAGHMEREEATKAKVKRSLAYPVFVMVLAVCAVAVMMAFVVPAITMMFDEFRADLPMMTRGMIAVSGFFQANIGYMTLSALLIGGGGFLYMKTDAGKRKKDYMLIKVPVLGPAILKGGLARFCRNMSMLVGAGVTLFEALKLTSETTDNCVIAEALTNVRERVGDGQLLSQAVIIDPVFPSLMGEMVAVGEEAGSLQEQLTRVSNFYEEEAERSVSQITGMLTPALTIGVGLMIGLIAVTIFSSIYSMAGALPE